MPEFPPKPPPLPQCSSVADAMPDAARRWWTDQSRVDSSAWLISFLVHGTALFIMGLITFGVDSGVAPINLLAQMGKDEPTPDAVHSQPLVVEPDIEEGVRSKELRSDAPPLDVPLEAPEVVLTGKSPSEKKDTQHVASGPQTKPSKKPTDKPRVVATPTGGGWEGRDPNARPALAGKHGGNKQSELAVERGLRWLAAHQRQDGSWSFDLTKPPCGGLCRNSGTEASATAATGIALLPFLGAGYTHKQGEHQRVVKRGLYSLGARAVVTPHGIDLRGGGTMYAQALAAIALCEAYGMTRDEALKEVAQGALRFIVYAQDLEGGGWRYTPGEPGDITVTGWQLMALRSGQLAKLEVPSPTIGLIEKFLDSVQTDGGARYRYQAPRKPEQTTTAVGLLCRMYLGWDRDRPALYQGVTFLHTWGPSKSNVYYDYYATQVLHFWEGPEWQAWNLRMRDHLIATQSQTSHESGSWHFADSYGNRGGRLYTTAMALMILEVYYRHMPLFEQRAVNEPF